MMCGKRGLWPPYLRSERGLLAVGMALVKGIVKTVHAIKAVDPRAVMVHVEATGLIRAGLPELEPLAQEQRLRDYLFLDLVSGRVSAEHPLLGWMLSNGVRRNDLRELSDHPIALDIIGLNFYPQWSTRELWIDEQGRLDSRLVEPDGAGFAGLIDGFWQRYQVPFDDHRDQRETGSRAQAALARNVGCHDQRMSCCGCPGARVYLVSAVYDGRLALSHRQRSAQRVSDRTWPV